MKKILLTALSCSVFALGACGGGGGGVASTPTPTPPPAPTPAPAPTYSTIEDLEGSNTLQSATLAYTNTLGGQTPNVLASFDTQQFGSGLVAEYDVETDTFVLTSQSGATITLTEADIDPTVPFQPGRLVFRQISQDGLTDNRVSLFLGGSSLNTQYLAVGSWNRIPTQGQVRTLEVEIALSGVPTIGSDVPTTQTASYTTSFSGIAVNPVGTVYSVSSQDSTLDFDVDFGAGDIDVAFDFFGQVAPVNANTVVEPIGRLAGTANIGAGTNGYLGDIAGTLFGSNASGEIVGAFFGPQAVETGFAYYGFALGASPISIVGSGIGVKNPTVP